MNYSLFTQVIVSYLQNNYNSISNPKKHTYEHIVRICFVEEYSILNWGH